VGAKRDFRVLIVGAFAAVAGIGEVVVGITGNYLGILSHPMAPSIATAVVGAFYSLGGLFILTLRKWGAAIGILFIVAEVLGRVYLVGTGITPAHGLDGLKIVVGGVIALALVAYALWRWRSLT